MTALNYNLLKVFILQLYRKLRQPCHANNEAPTASRRVRAPILDAKQIALGVPPSNTFYYLRNALEILSGHRIYYPTSERGRCNTLQRLFQW